MVHSPGQPVDQIAQLNAARNLVLGDAAFYPQIVNGIIPLIGAHARLEMRRWGADFLAETFASPVLAAAQKESLALAVLRMVQEILELPETDAAVLKSVVQVMASLYPLVFRHIISHPEDREVWHVMTVIKQGLLQRWDSFPSAVQVCCIKFVQRVVQVQSHGLISDPRRPEQNETSLAIVPKDHAILSLPILEAEASGLLDRLLAIFQEDSNDPLLVNATLNCLPALVRSRQAIANKIINTITNFNPVQQSEDPVAPAVRIKIKSMERTTRAFVMNVMKKNPNHPLAGKMQQYLDRLMQSRLDTADDEGPRKRRLLYEPTDGLDSAKRARLDAETPPLIKIPPLPPGPLSYAQLYTLTEDIGLSSFDVKQLPSDIILRIVIPVLTRIDQSLLSQAADGIRTRYLSYSKYQATHAQPAPEDGDDDYEPEYQPMDTVGNLQEQAGAVSTEAASLLSDLVTLGPVVLPQPPPMSEAEACEIGRDTVDRMFGMLASTASAPKPTKSKGQRPLGFSRLAGSTFDRDAWVILLTRLATRAPAGLKVEDCRRPTISDSIRDILYRYILEDFRSRLSIGITWLNEEWYNDRVQIKFFKSQHDAELGQVPTHYEHWVLRLLDGLLPYLDARDTKLFIRFLSEIPEVSVPITQRVSSLAKDPERVNLCVQSLLYVIMFRPPAREISLNALADIYETYEDSRPTAGKILAKWRPNALEKFKQQPPTTLVSKRSPGPLAGCAAQPEVVMRTQSES